MDLLAAIEREKRKPEKELSKLQRQLRSVRSAAWEPMQPIHLHIV
jgi:hypothetical protein